MSLGLGNHLLSSPALHRWPPPPGSTLRDHEIQVLQALPLAACQAFWSSRSALACCLCLLAQRLLLFIRRPVKLDEEANGTEWFHVMQDFRHNNSELVPGQLHIHIQSLDAITQFSFHYPDFGPDA